MFNVEKCINDLLEIAIILIEYGRRKTLCSRAIQSSLKIYFKNNEKLLKCCVNLGTKYYFIHHDLKKNEKVEDFVSKYSINKKILEDFIKGKECIFDKYSVSYLCGVYEVFKSLENESECENEKKTFNISKKKKMDDEPIYFYSHSGNNKYGWMSNFYPSNFIDGEGNKFSCSEQYLMYMKAKTFEPENYKLFHAILNEINPAKMKQYGRKVKNYDDNIWNNIRYGVMVDGLRFKFEQNLNLKKLLVETGDKTIYEASKTDKIWGIGFSPTDAPNTDKKLFGSNLLGEALMQVRNEFK